MQNPSASISPLDESKGKQIVQFILSKADCSPDVCNTIPSRSTREPKKGIQVNSHAKNFLGNKPLVFLMSMFLKYGKSRFEIAFVFPDCDGTYQEREQKGTIVPKNGWIDGCCCTTVLTSYASTKRTHFLILKRKNARSSFACILPGIAIKSWSARPIACFVRGDEHASVEFFSKIHPNENPKLENHIRKVQMFATIRQPSISWRRQASYVQGHNKEIVVIQIDQSNEF